MSDHPRLAAVRDKMNADGVDLLLAFSTSFHTFLDMNPVLSLTGFKPMGESVVAVERDGPATLIVTPAWEVERAAARARADRTLGRDDLVSAVAEHLQGRETEAAMIGVAGLNALPRATTEPLSDLFQNRAVSFDQFLLSAGRCKLPEEIEDARAGARIADKLWDRMVEVARPGMREFELSADLNAHSKLYGAEDNFLLVASSQHNRQVRPAERRIMEEGDILLAEITPSVNGQFSQICRTAVIGAPPDALVEDYDLLIRCMERGSAAATPGRTIGEVTEDMNEVLRGAGYGDYCGPPYMRVRGHGLGNISSLPGDVAADNETVLEEGMVFVMHPNQYLPRSGYLLCGEPVVITPAGAEPLTENFSALRTIPV